MTADFIDSNRHPLELPLRTPEVDADADASPGPLSLVDALACPSVFVETLHDLVDAVGGVDHLSALSADALPAFRVDLDRIGLDLGEDIRQFVADVLDVIEHGMHELMRQEERTICHLLVDRLHSHAEFRRGTVCQTAASIVWIALSASGALGRRHGQLTASFIWNRFGVSAGAERAQRLLRIVNPAHVSAPWFLGRRVWIPDARLMTGRTRSMVIELRDQAVARIAADDQRKRERYPIQWTPAGVSLRGRRLRPLWVRSITASDGRDHVVMALDDVQTPGSEGEFVMIDPVEAQRLLIMLENALDVA